MNTKNTLWPFLPVISTMIVLGLFSCNRNSTLDAIQKDTFIKYYGGGKDQKAGKVLQAADGGYVVVGSSNSFSLNGDYDQMVVKTDAYGNQTWLKTFGGKGDDYARDIKSNPDGTGYVFVGDKTITNANLPSTSWSSLFNIRKISLTGDSLGSYYFGDTLLSSLPKGRNTGIALALTNNEIFFSGYTSNTSTSLGVQNLYAGKVSYSGKFNGGTIYGTNNDIFTNTGMTLEDPNSISPTIYTIQNVKTLLKSTGVKITNSDAQTMLNPVSTSPPQTIDNYGTNGVLSETIQSVNDIKMLLINGQLTPILTGMRNNKPYVLGLKSNFNSVNPNWFDINLNLSATLAEPKAICLTKEGGFVITGYFENSGNTANGKDIFLAYLSSTGAVQWSKSFGGSGDDEGVDVIQTSDGGYLISANIGFGTNNNVIGLIKVKSDGTLK